MTRHACVATNLILARIYDHNSRELRDSVTIFPLHLMVKYGCDSRQYQIRGQMGSFWGAVELGLQDRASWQA